MFLKFTKEYLTYEIGSVLKVSEAVLTNLEAAGVAEEIDEKTYKSFSKKKIESDIAKSIARTKKSLTKERDCEDCEGDDCEECKKANESAKTKK